MVELLKNALIIGASKGLGSDLWKILSQDNAFEVTGVARSKAVNNNTGLYIQADVSSLDECRNLEQALLKSKKSFSMIIYCTSLWQDHESFSTNQLAEFIETGPFGFLRCMEILFNNKLLEENATIINIGSIATLTSCLDQQNHPSYTAAKQLQLSIANTLQSKMSHTNARITTLTLGGLVGEDRIPSQDVAAIINCIAKLSPASRPLEIVMPSAEDLKLK